MASESLFSLTLKVLPANVVFFIFLLFYFIYLPHTITYIINKHNKDYNK